MSHIEFIAMLPDDPELKRLLDLFDAVAPLEYRQKGELEKQVKLGHFTVQRLVEDGVNSHLIGWHIAYNGVFWLDLVLRLEKPMPHEAFFATMEKFARDKGAPFLTWAVKRKGLAIESIKHGFIPELLILTKKL